HAITTDAWRNSLDHYQEFVIIVALDLKIEEEYFPSLCLLYPLAESLATRSNSCRRQAHQK
ncbi:hypothetical protein EFP44_09195, partial [Lacticaseibacillus paracasei]|nr:hypothetical protein [Lacticaseibacillus paracasei]